MASKILLVCSFLILSLCFGGARTQGLSRNYYDISCPNLAPIVRTQLKKVFKNDIGQAAGLLRLHFHDCFVQGCDGSVLLDGSASGPGEQSAPPNLSLRAEAFKIINDLRRRVHDKCGRVVSCADILAVAARDAVFLVSASKTSSPNTFDNKYYVDLMNRQGLFTSDQDLYTDPRTRPTVTAFAVNQTLFFDKFVAAMIKMSLLGVLTGSQGEVRANCSARNAYSVLVSSVGEAEEARSGF
ncbi:peroxidase 12-like [Salvia hispanica]|uniref:peroxidase 12-like n=1 Tax=Salvia hispanica TaxID=49212 RepID=UPI0020093504|nr:peroxidase 12-like [Salvia hispanica]